MTPLLTQRARWGYYYSNSVTSYPTETPFRATCKAQVCIGVDNAGDFKIIETKYDGSGSKQTVLFGLR